MMPAKPKNKDRSSHENRREYMRSYIKKYRQKRTAKRVSISFTPSEFTLLKSRADAQGMRPSRYLREIYFAFHEDERILSPEIQNAVLDMMVQLRGAANNINQIAKHLNTEAKSRPFWFGGKNSASLDPKQIKQSILDLEKPVVDFLRQWQK